MPQSTTEPRPQATCTESLLKFGHLVFEICSWTLDRQTKCTVQYATQRRGLYETKCVSVDLFLNDTYHYKKIFSAITYPCMATVTFENKGPAPVVFLVKARSLMHAYRGWQVGLLQVSNQHATRLREVPEMAPHSETETVLQSIDCRKRRARHGDTLQRTVQVCAHSGRTVRS